METLIVAAIIWGVEYWIGRTDKVKSNSVPEATIGLAKAAVIAAVSFAKGLK